VNRFFVPAGTTALNRFPLPAQITHQVRRVLRLVDGDRIALLEGDGIEAICHLDGGECIVEERRPSANEPTHRLIVSQALIKGDGLEQVVRHGTEIGIAGFRLIVTERCVVRQLSAGRLQRLRSIAREAAEQAERGIVPTVGAPVSLAEVLSPTSVVLLERHARRLADLPPPGEVIIGPEGGFGPSEVAAANEAGTPLAGLGPRILRSETVALAAGAVILSRAGDFA
jgi:16S rRNA (uracil1498-N3)-methyltransferase